MIDLSTYHLTFSDEFNTLSISPNGSGTTWASTRPDSVLRPGVDIGYGLTAFVDSSTGVEPFTIANGALEIEATPAPSSIKDQIGGATWTSGLLQSKTSFSQTYGYFEMRAELPAEAGTWPAFWMLAANGDWPPEIDVVETYGADPTGLSNTVHTGASGQITQNTQWSSQATLTSGFHTFGALWTPTTITFYYDDSPVARVDTPTDANTAMYPVVSLAMTGANALVETPKSMLVDYVRVYSADSSVEAIDLGPISSPDGLATADLHGASTRTAPSATPPSAAAPDTLVIRISGDSWNGPPQFIVTMDGTRIGDIYDVAALHAAGQWQDISIHGAFGTGAHDVSITYLNDANSGPYYDASTNSFVNDRNLFVSSVTLGGTTYGFSAVVSNSASLGFDWLDTSSSVMAGNGTLTYHIGSTNPSTMPPTVTPPTTPSPSADVGTKQVTLHISGDSWNGPPQFKVSIDGKQIGGTHDVTATHSLNQWQDIAIDATLDGGAHSVSITYLNDANQDAYYKPNINSFVNDRNIFVKTVTIGGVSYGRDFVSTNSASIGFEWLDTTASVMAGNGTVTFAIPALTGAAPPTQPSTSPPAAEGTLVFHISGDSWNGPPQFTVFVNGKQAGGTYDVTALHAQHQWQDITLSASIGQGPHTIELRYMNDANSNPYYDPALGFVNDRNLFVSSISFNGTKYGADHVTSNTGEIGFAWLDPSAIVMAGNGSLIFQV